ncbi:tetratricopeptide repeat protein [Sulfurivirga sp.]|uniref:tetratricopeptide repeat protein n=1 Tax=Sulfurivirga sp. TaxID=2614236 RepID=UPI0025E0E593|nr:tetratricopeptide repeat protein [Sulfurivirga sp.]
MRLWLLGLLMVSVSAWAQQDPWQAYREHRWQAALQDLAGEQDWRAQMAAGLAAWKLKQYGQAILLFRQAVWLGRTDRQRAQALLNLGDAFYADGQLAAAVETFEQALIYQPDFTAARQNLETARAALQQWLAQQRRKKPDLGTKRLNEDFAFAGGRKPVGGKTRDEWDNRVGRHGDHGPDLLAADAGLQHEAVTPMGQLRQAERMPPLEQAQRVERFTQRLSQLQDAQWALQQRLFEREEGFEAAQSAPHDIKGAAPW